MRYRTILIIAFLLTFIGLSVQASVEINYQGQLTDDAGDPVNSSGVPMTFTIYYGTNTLWTSGLQTVAVSDGLFNHILGSGNPIPDSVFNHTDLYLGIQIGTDAEITPRTKLTSAAYSAVANKLVGGDVETGDGYLKITDDSEEISIGSVSRGAIGINFKTSQTYDRDLITLTGDPLGENRLDLYLPGEDAEAGIVQVGANPTDGGYMSIHAAEPLLAEKVRIGGSSTDTGFVTLFDGGHDTEQALISMTSITGSGGSIKMFQPQPEPPGHELITMSTQYSSGGSIKMFQPQPEPPGREALAMSVNPTSGTSIKMFQPQPEPPGEPLMEFIGDDYGSQINMYGAASKASTMEINLNAGAEEVGIIINDKPGTGIDSSSINLDISPTETGIIIVDSRPDATSGSIDLNSDATSTGIIIVDSKTDGTSGSINLNSGLTETGIIIINSKPSTLTSSIDLGSNAEETGIIIINNRDNTTAGSIDLKSAPTETGIIIINSRPGGSSGVVDIFADDNNAAVLIQNQSTAKATNPSIDLRANNDSGTVVITGQTPPMGGIPPVITMLTRQDSAKVGIGTDTPSEALAVVGNIVATGSISEYTTTKMKTNIDPINDAVEIVQDLNGVRYNWKSDEYPKMKFSDKRQIGLLAEDVEKVLPELVHSDNEGNLSVAYTKLTAVLVEAVKELKQENEELKKRIEALEQ